MPIRRFFLPVAILAGLFSTVAQAQQTDVIRGRVTGPDTAVAGVNVTVTSISGNVSRTTRTDSNGRFTVTFPGGDGDYMVSFTALGYAPKRFEVKRTADEDILIADTKLTRVGAVLDAVTVTAERERVRRNDIPPDVSGTEQSVNNAAVPADLLGDLAAMAASLPGVQAVPGADGAADGYSVLGLGADQNNTTLNGMQFGGSSLPRDAAVGSSVITSPYDVSRGGFSGAQMSLRTRSGSNFVTRGMSANIDAPGLQWSDRAAQALGNEYSNLSLGGLLSGPIKFDKSFYNISYQLGRRANDLHTLLTTDADGLQAAGVSSDSVGRLLSILGQKQVPFSLADAATERLGDQGSLFGSLDFAPPSSSTGQAVNISFNGNWNRQRPATGLATELPGHSGDRTNWRGGLQARHNNYFGIGILSETSVGASVSRNWSSPFLQLPAGRVRVSSLFDDGTSAVQSLMFGGNQNLNSSQTTNNVGLLNQMSWFSTNNKHRLKLTTELRRDGSSLEQASNLLGTFAFNSLTDLNNEKASSYTRQLGTRQRDVSQLVGGISLGDSWRRTTNLQIQYGVRVDANRFMSRPDFNAQVESLFGLKNDEMPNRFYVSPRVGFSWTYGTASQIAGFEGAARNPRAVVRGGIGIFQNMPSTNLIGPSIDNTGLASAIQQLTCVGAAAPIPDWDAYADASAIPDRCADGTLGSVFANASPNVSVFSKDFSAPRSVRSNLQWSGPTLGNRFSTSIDATVSLNLNQQGTIDRNFNPRPRFTLADEGGRPVYVLPTSIVPETGAIASRDARVSGNFSRVSEIVSDLRSESKQISFRVSPIRFSSGLTWNLSYVYSNVREQSRGFGSTVGNPLDLEWGRSGFDSRHQVVYNLGYNFFDFVRVNWFGQFRSGNPFTPMVAGDVNGDGYSNDRAFVFQPGSTQDPAVSAGIQSLLEKGPDAARNCLSKQLGQLAARNSCQSPWSSFASMSISFNPVKVRMPQRATLSFQLSNPLGAADLMLNGSGKLRGWGQQSFPDQSLLYVRGFDRQTGRYKYEVNQRFGSTNQAFGAFRNPVTLTAMLRFDVGPTRERQLLTQQLDRGRRTSGQKAAEPMLRAMYGSGGIPNPMATILRQQDSLKLSAAQADSIAVLNRLYTMRNDAIWSPVAKYFAQLGERYDRDEAYEKYIDARKATVDLMIRLAPAIKDLLTAEQERKLPAFVSGFLEPRYLASIRSGTASFTGGMNFGGGPMMGSDVMFTAQAGGGGGTQVIIRQ
ncbi:MAG TPA: carboxypeptidase regulatory-like domain-containing protein [Gemmatimonadaceae bacterium]|nr:carboxypeptidase regulatory-like domain-containing protein [Gemmatimonadaceae bacterium]